MDLNMAQQSGTVSAVIPGININGDIPDTVVTGRIKDKLRINQFVLGNSRSPRSLSQITVPYVCPTGVREIIPQSVSHRRQSSALTGYMDRHIPDVPTHQASVAMSDIRVPEPDFVQVVLLAQIKHDPSVCRVSTRTIKMIPGRRIPLVSHELLSDLSIRSDQACSLGKVPSISRGCRDPGNLSSRTSHRHHQCDPDNQTCK